MTSLHLARQRLALAIGAVMLTIGASSVAQADSYQLTYKVAGLAKSTPASTPETDAPDTDFTSHAFTTCGASGRLGPTLQQCLTAYSGQEVLGDEYAFSVNQGIQEWTVPATATYRIDAYGAQGGSLGAQSGGKGAHIAGNVSLSKGNVIRILAGQVGTGAANGAGGGGATIVALGTDPLIIAGGGGGATYYGSGRTHGKPGTSDQNATSSTVAYGHCGAITPPGGAAEGTGGVSGYGGGGGCAAGGAGWYGDGGTGQHAAVGGASFLNGGSGGLSSNPNGYPHGGFGGGGAGSPRNGYGGGGGGYSGGGGGNWYDNVAGNGGGGGSFNAGQNPTMESGINSGQGRLTITLLP